MTLGFNAIVADGDEEAELLATSQQQAFTSIRAGQPIQLPPPKRGYTEELPREARTSSQQIFAASAIGNPETARRQVEEFVNRTQPDEMMVTAQIFDHAARLRSYELFMQAVPQTSPLVAN